MTEDAAAKEKPSQSLASRITARLAKEGLIAEDRQARVESALAAGSIDAEEWRLEIERAFDRKEGAENATQNKQD